MPHMVYPRNGVPKDKGCLTTLYHTTKCFDKVANTGTLNAEKRTSFPLQRSTLMPALSVAFRAKARDMYETHPVVKDNPHTVPFAAAPQGPNHAQVVDLIEQFAHFSLIFLVSQCKAMIHAPTEEIERGARSILVNENGVGINVETGNCERKVFSHLAAHINWLREIALLLKMPIWPDGRHAKFGTAERATRYTRDFSSLLDRVFGSPNPNIACAASFVIESWAGYGIGTEYEY